MTAVQMDFRADWLDLARARLRNAGLRVPDNDKEVALLALSPLCAALDASPREVLLASDLACPEHLRSGLREIVRKCEAGESLRPHMTRGIKGKPAFDGLLSDWGIHHLHLGSQGKWKFVERTGPLLFARITEKRVLMIAVKLHGSAAPVDPFTLTELLETVLREWPEELAPFRSTGLGPDRLSPEQRQPLRKKHANANVTLSNGATYFPPGGGHVSSGASLAASIECDREMCELDNLESWVLDNLETLRARLPKGRHFGQPPSFVLAGRTNQGAPIVTERTADVSFTIEQPH